MIKITGLSRASEKLMFAENGSIPCLSLELISSLFWPHLQLARTDPNERKKNIEIHVHVINATQIKIEISSQLLKLHAWRNHNNLINYMFATKTKEELHVRYIKHPINLMALPVLWEYHLVPSHHHLHRHVLRHLRFLLKITKDKLFKK